MPRLAQREQARGKGRGRSDELFGLIRVGNSVVSTRWFCYFFEFLNSDKTFRQLTPSSRLVIHVTFVTPEARLFLFSFYAFSRAHLYSCCHSFTRACHSLAPPSSPFPCSFVMGYTIHAGQALEEVPQRRGPLNLHGVKGWYDFYASQCSVDSEGFVDAKTVGMKHVAVRDDGRDSEFKPNPRNIGPRTKEWKSTNSNTQKGAAIQQP